jgi:ATP-dependent protease Clp ATPase subunit
VCSLKEFAHYLPDWQRLAEDFACQIDLVKDKLGQDLFLTRNDVEAIDLDRSVSALVGASGSGKTALAKEFACQYAVEPHAVWLTASLLNSGRPTIFFANLGLTFSFQELLSQTLIQRGIIVVDGIERLNQTGLASACESPPPRSSRQVGR